MNKQELAQKIWASANQMRSKIEANEYKDYILGFIFYKYLSDKEVRFLKENDYDEELLKSVTEEDPETVKWVQENLGYFIAYPNLYSTWLQLGKDFGVAHVRDALSAFSRLISKSHRKVFDKIFDTLQTGLSKLGDSAGSQTKAIRGLLGLIKDIPMDGRQDYDVLGFIYEYLISNFAANAGKKAGEFYTPHEVSLLMSEIVADHLKGRSEIKIYDSTSGSGSLLINIGQSVARYMNDRDNIKYYAQEWKENTYNLTRMNLVMRGIKPDNIVTRNGDTLEEDWPYFDPNDPVNSYTPLRVDAVVSNPPYSQAWDPSNKEGDPRFALFGLAPRGKADYAFLLHDLFHIKHDGIMTIVLPHGVLFRGGEEGVIRRNLIEGNHIDAIIGLPANIFFGTGIPTIIMVLRQKRERTDVLVIDASKGFIKDGKNNKLRASDIKRIVDTIISRSSVPKFARVVSREEIRNNEYNLNIPRYVDSSEAAESWDIYASMFGGISTTEIDEMQDYWEVFPTLKKDLFRESDIPYVECSGTDFKKSIKNHPDVLRFEAAFKAAFASFPTFLKTVLLDQRQNVDIIKAKDLLSEDIFQRLKDFPLIDKYEAFQLFDDAWSHVSIDLEVLQSEGFSAVKKVDPKLVIKKKNGKDEEIQEGWTGHLLPFDLVQETLLSENSTELHQLQTSLAGIPEELEALLDTMSEEDKESCNEVLSEEGDAFIPKELSRMLKEIKKDTSPEGVALRSTLEKAEALQKSERELKAQLKSKTAELQAKTKETIEQLSDEEALALLEKKWIEPLSESLLSLPHTVIDKLINAIQALQNKYAITFYDLQQQIHQSETALSEMIDQLEGSKYDLLGLAELQKLLGGHCSEGSEA